jgi:uncharacterized protein (UPF0548 family)
MTDERLLGGPRTRRRLARLTDKRVNFDAPDPSLLTPADGWHLDDLCQELPPEPPGMPVEGGSWEIARRLMNGYEFADPSIVRAYYDPGLPLEGRNMLLKLRALGVVRVFVGVRVGDVYEEDRDLSAGRAHVWGWSYRTLEGHVEQGQMDWEVWKWEESGEVQFRVHSVSRSAHHPNPLVRLGFHLLRGHERKQFLEGARRRMRALTELALEHGTSGEIRQAAAELTLRPMIGEGEVHDELAHGRRWYGRSHG